MTTTQEQTLFTQPQEDLSQEVWDVLIAKPKVQAIKKDMERFLEGLR